MKPVSSVQVREQAVWNMSGWVGVLVCVLLLGAAGKSSMAVQGAESLSALIPLGFVGLFILAATGFVIVQPMQCLAVQFFGSYVGTIREEGLRWTLPLTSRRPVSLRLRNFESPRLKVNDADGNPIEIAAIVVWRIVDSAQALFNVDQLDAFIEKQTESSLRILATRYPYDQHGEQRLSLHGHIDEVNEHLEKQVNGSLRSAGIQIEEARISHLAYAPEIAAAMLQRQQAQAIIAARQKIVDGAVGMVEMALRSLTSHGIVELDEERKAAMVSNLLVVLCSERPTQPVLNTGSIY